MTAIAVGVVDVAVNPNNTAQRYILWNNGRIDAIGGAVPVTDQRTWYTRFEPPGVALQVTNWTTGSGYVLDYRGGFNPFGGAPELGSTATDGFAAGVPAVSGVPVSGSPQTRLYVDWSWDPSGTGQGYVMDLWGGLTPFGGATTPTQAGRRFATARARRLEMRWSPSKGAVIMDMFGSLYGNFGTIPGSHSAPFKPAIFDAYRDLIVMDWTTGSVSGYQLDLYGGMVQFGGRAPTYGWPYRPSGRARRLAVLSTSPERFWQVWAGAEQFEYVSSTPPTVIAGAGTSDVQTVTVTGSPTGGSFTLTFSGQTTAAIAFNATAGAMQTALRALSGIGSTGVTVTKAGQVFTVTFAGTLAKTDVPQMTATSSLTGGTSPNVTVATTVGGQDASPKLTVTDSTRPDLTWTYTDPQSDQQKAWQLLVFTQTFANGHTMTDPLVWSSSALVAREGVDPTARGIASPIDFANGSYRLFVRAKDTADQWSAWDSHDWTQNVAAPVTPTGLTATANQTTATVALSVSTSAGVADLVRFEASDDGGVTWAPVYGADAVTRTATTTATDRFAPLGVTRTYRAMAYAVDPRVISAPSNTVTATLTKLTYLLSAVDDATLGGEVSVQGPVSWERPVTVGVFQGLSPATGASDSDYPTVVKGGRPKALRTELSVITETRAEWDRFKGLAESGSTLVYRDPFGEVIYCEIVGGWGRTQLEAAPRAGEFTPLGHVHTQRLPLAQVRPPHLDA